MEDNSAPENALFSLEQRVDTSFGSVIRAQVKGKGDDLVFMFVKALEASEQEKTDLKRILVDALMIFESTGNQEELMTMRGKSKSDIVN